MSIVWVLRLHLLNVRNLIGHCQVKNHQPVNTMMWFVCTPPVWPWRLRWWRVRGQHFVRSFCGALIFSFCAGFPLTWLVKIEQVPGFPGKIIVQVHSYLLFSDHVFMSYLIWLVVWIFFYFSIYWVNHPNWLIFFRGVGIPPTSNVLLFRCINHQSNFHEPNITIFMGSKSSHKWGVSYRGTPVIIQVMDDHGLVLKPMVTTGVAGRHGRRLKRWNLYLGKL